MSGSEPPPRSTTLTKIKKNFIYIKRLAKTDDSELIWAVPRNNPSLSALQFVKVYVPTTASWKKGNMIQHEVQQLDKIKHNMDEHLRRYFPEVLDNAKDCWLAMTPFPKALTLKEFAKGSKSKNLPLAVWTTVFKTLVDVFEEHTKIEVQHYDLHASNVLCIWEKGISIRVIDFGAQGWLDNEASVRRMIGDILECAGLQGDSDICKLANTWKESKASFEKMRSELVEKLKVPASLRKDDLAHAEQLFNALIADKTHRWVTEQESEVAIAEAAIAEAAIAEEAMAEDYE